ncbi:MAG: hypothetical protein WA705_28970 [Candidatus Ozemobacteraceae bacterium]
MLVSSNVRKEASVSDSEQNLFQETLITFNSSPESIELHYRNGGRVIFTGAGQIKIFKDGINVETGKFKARFKNLAGTLKVRVPIATLGIRGTEIQFDIQPTKAEILLIEGAADLTPDNTALKTIRLEKGKKVLFANNIWTLSHPKPQTSSVGGQKRVSEGSVASSPENRPSNGSEEIVIPDQRIEGEADSSEERVPTEPAIETGEEPVSPGREGFGDSSPSESLQTEKH